MKQIMTELKKEYLFLGNTELRAIAHHVVVLMRMGRTQKQAIEEAISVSGV